jgi:nitrogen fixation protein NifU and related proteins
MYREEFMEHYKHPQNRGHMEDPTVEITEDNPMCGDVITIQLKIDGGKIEDAKFDGEACAVSVVSASLLTDEIKGKTVEEAESITKEELLEMVGGTLTTSRVKCAELPLLTLKGALEVLNG